MTLLAPKFKSSLRPIAGGQRQARVYPSVAVGRSISRAGEIIRRRGEELKRERDVAVVGDLYNQWRDADREELDNLLSLEGKNAVNLGSQYDTAFYNTQSKIGEQSENGTQQAMLRDLLNRKREQNLDRLAIYEAAELQRYKKQSQVGMVANAEEDARQAGFADIMPKIDEVSEYLIDANPGMAPEGLEHMVRTVTSQLYLANTQSIIEEDPDRAMSLLEDRKAVLGKNYAALKNRAEVKSKEKLVERLRDELNVKHTDGIEPNFNNMEDEISKADIPDDIKDSVIVWIRSQESEYKQREKLRKDEIQDSEMDVIFNSIRGGDLPGAYQAVLEASELSETQKFRIENIIKSQQSTTFKTDATEYIEASKAAHLQAISRDEIINGIGTLWSPQDGQILLNQLKAAEAPGTKELNKSIKDAEDALEKQIVKGNQLVGYDTASVDDAYQAIKDFQKQINDPPEDVTVEDMLDPQSEHYILEDIVNKYLVPIDEQIRRMTDSYRTGETARKPGESIEDFEKRNAK